MHFKGFSGDFDRSRFTVFAVWSSLVDDLFEWRKQWRIVGGGQLSHAPTGLILLFYFVCNL